MSDVPKLKSRPVEPESDDERVPLCVLDGAPHSIPKVPSASAAMRYLREVQRFGPEVAMAGLLDRMLGSASYDAIVDANLTEEEYAELGAAVERHMLGALEGKARKRTNKTATSSNGSVKSAG